MAPEQPAFELVLNVITLVDVSRLKRELAQIDDFMLQAKVRKPGQQMDLPRTSHNLDEIAAQNKLNLLQDQDRKQLTQKLEDLQARAPVMHISFAADPSPVFLKRLITWLRQEIHPELLLQIGLQPSIAAGCVVRTTNKYFDFSLRKHFDQQKQLLLNKLKESTA